MSDTDAQNDQGNKKKTDSDQETNNKEVEIYPSSELLLSAIQREYDKEEERPKNLDVRVGIFISLSAALLAFISTYIKIGDLKNIMIDNVFSAIPYALFIILIFLTIVLLLAAICYFLRVVSVKEYQRIKLEDFVKEQNNRANKDIVAYALIQIYKQNIEHNTSINNEKMKLYTRGVYCISAAIILSVILYMISLNFN